MKYYCQYCRAISDIGARDEQDYEIGHCGFCGDCGGLVHYPEYETPAQYEKRTGNVFPDNGLVWFRFRWENGRKHTYKWSVTSFKNAMGYCCRPYCDLQIVIADPPISPSDDWKPEE